MEVKAWEALSEAGAIGVVLFFAGVLIYWLLVKERPAERELNRKEREADRALALAEREQTRKDRESDRAANLAAIKEVVATFVGDSARQREDYGRHLDKAHGDCERRYLEAEANAERRHAQNAADHERIMEGLADNGRAVRELHNIVTVKKAIEEDRLKREADKA